MLEILQHTPVMEVILCWDQLLVGVSQMELGVMNHQHVPRVRSAQFLCSNNFIHFSIAVGFQLNGQFYASGSTLSLSSIGEGDSALLCTTDAPCCRPPNRAGEFYYPGNSPVRTEGTGDNLYRNRGDGMIRLNRRNGATSPTGTYKCEIPDSSELAQEIFITLT